LDGKVPLKPGSSVMRVPLGAPSMNPKLKNMQRDMVKERNLAMAMAI
jgi:hypothetical protein